MNTSDQNYDPVTEEQASLWAARLEGSSLSAADRAALDAWLAEKPVHRVLLSDYCQFSADLEQLLPSLVAAGRVMEKNLPWTRPMVSQSSTWVRNMRVR